MHLIISVNSVNSINDKVLIEILFHEICELCHIYQINDNYPGNRTRLKSTQFHSARFNSFQVDFGPDST